MIVPMMEEKEWEQVFPLLSISSEQHKEYMKKNNCDLKTSIENFRKAACDKYEELTEYKETNANALWHHHLKNFGPECDKCGHLYRTNKASYCANCGNPREQNI